MGINSEANNAIRKYFQDNWTDTPIAYENIPEVDFTDPARPKLFEGDTNYALIEIFFGNTNASEVGQSTTAWRRLRGDITVKLHIKKESGTHDEAGYIDLLRELFEQKDIGNARIGSSRILNTLERASWRVIPVMFNFTIDYRGT